METKKTKGGGRKKIDAVQFFAFCGDSRQAVNIKSFNRFVRIFWPARFGTLNRLLGLHVHALDHSLCGQRITCLILVIFLNRLMSEGLKQ